jgi:hypothetical protein
VKPAKVAVSVSSNCLLAVTLLLQQTEQEVDGSLNVEIGQQKALAEGLGALKLALLHAQGLLALAEARHLAEQALGGLAGVDRHCSPRPR